MARTPSNEEGPIDNIKVDEMIERLFKKFVWLDEKIKMYEDEEAKALKLIDQLNKTAATLLKLLQIRGGEVSEEDLASILSKVPAKIMRKVLKVGRAKGREPKEVC